MTRRQRQAHLAAWWVIALAIAALTGAVVAQREQTRSAIAAVQASGPR